MLPVHKSGPAKKGSSLPIFLVVVLCIALGGQYVYWKQQLNGLVISNEELTEELGAVKVQVSTLNDARGELAGQKNDLQAQVTARDEKIKSVEKEADNLRDEVNSSNNELQSLKDKEQDLQSTKDQQTQDLAAANEKINTLQGELDAAKKSVQEKDMEIDSLKAKIAAQPAANPAQPAAGANNATAQAGVTEAQANSADTAENTEKTDNAAGDAAGDAAGRSRPGEMEEQKGEESGIVQEEGVTNTA